jgi:hypothetical protein
MRRHIQMIKWKLPTADDPGFLRRRRELASILDAEPTPENNEKLIEYLKDYVDAENPVETLLEASQREYGAAVLHLMGFANMVPDPKGGSSGQP